MVYVWSQRAIAAAAAGALVAASVARAADAPAEDVSAQLAALKARVAQLEAQQGENWMSKERETQIRGVVQDVLKDAKSRGDLLGGSQIGYSSGSGFYIQSADGNNKLSISGFIQARYEGSIANAFNGRTVRNGNGVTVHDPVDSSGFDIRRARVSFAGNIFSPDLTYKFEGDFYGGSGGAFTVTDAFVAYRFADPIKVKVGSYKVPFAKAELTSDTQMSFAERAEVLNSFDPVRALGVSVYGDLVKDQLSYEVAANDGGSSNTLKADDTIGSTANLDNRFGFYGRVQWAGSGKISDFAEESDLRDDNRAFIWMLGGAVGYESQNARTSAFPSQQTSTKVVGLSNMPGGGAGYIGDYTLNGDIYRATLDWSAKVLGLSANVAGYFQQINVGPGATAPAFGAAFADKTSFFQYGGYGQIGYFLVPQKFEVVGRAGVLGTEGGQNLGQYYSVGANYYVYKHNFKIVGDVTYVPEAAYTNASLSTLQNTQDWIFRLQVQLKF
jgi:hypothetical protein